MSRITKFCYLPGRESMPLDCLYLDDSLPQEPATELTGRGIDTVTAAEASLAGAPLDAQLTYASEDKRMFVTRLLPLTRYVGKPHVGVLVLSENATSEDLVNHVTNRLPMLPFPKHASVKSVPPLSEFIDSLHPR